MSNAISKKIKPMLPILLTIALALTLAFSFGAASPTAVAADKAENVIYSEDFSAGVDAALSEHLSVQDGAAVLKGGSMFTLPVSSDKLLASNNYAVSFDMKLNSESELCVHFIGLDGSTGENIYLCERGNGAYWLISDFNGHDIYNNTGDLHGGLDGTPVDLSEFVHVKFVHYEGYLELWINGTRRCVSHLSNFGNNAYQTRKAIEEGTITAFGLHAQNSEAVVIDNIEIIEAVGAETSYVESSSDQSLSSQKIFPLSAENLYRENFKVTGTFKLADVTKQGWFPTIKLMGLNASLLSKNGREYAVNVQSEVNNGIFTPGIYAQTEAADVPWTGTNGEPVTFAEGDDVVYRIEVYGDNFDFYLNGAKVIATTFTDLGITKGRLQYVKILSGNGGAYWTDFTYDGYEKTTAVDVKASAERIMTDESVTLTADVFGLKGESFNWYVNDVIQDETSQTLTLSNLTAGTYNVVYKSAATVSNVATVTVSEKMITIDADKKTAYPTDVVTVTATKLGDFTGETLKWYVNGEEKTVNGDTLILSDLFAGEYVIVYKSELTESNELTVNILESSIVIETDKNNYFIGETASFRAVLKGISQDETLSWYVNGQPVSGTTGIDFELSFAEYTAGDQISIVCKSAGGVESDAVSVNLAYDLMGEIKLDENYQTVYEDEIKEGGSYGNYSVGSDEDGAYLYSETLSGGNYYTMNCPMPASGSFIMEYKLYVPADITGKYFVYPVLTGLNSKYPGGMVETAIEVNAEGFSPYFKDQNSGKIYNTDDYGFGKDLSYETGAAKKGDWNDIAVVVQGQNISMYINGEISVFFKLGTATVPTGCGFNFYPDGGSGAVPLKLKGIKLSGVKEPAPELESVSLSISQVSAGLNETVNLTANLNPFNAEALTVEWFVNDEKVNGSTLSFAFSATEAGEYRIRCVVNGISSAEKTITVSAASPGSDDGGGNTLPAWGIALIVIGCLALAAGIVAGVIIIRKRKK